jgi:hypothetical protein
MRSLIPIAACLALTGCVSPRNDNLAIGERVQLETFTPHPPSTPRPSEQVIAPSITGISRADWRPTEMLVPVDGLTAFRTYARRTFWADKVARQRNENPTAVNSLELYGGSEEQQEYEMLNNAARAFLDVVLLIPRALVWAPWRYRQNPDETYSRYWRPERPEPRPIKPGDPEIVSP